MAFLSLSCFILHVALEISSQGHIPLYSTIFFFIRVIHTPFTFLCSVMGFLDGSEVNNQPANARDVGLIPGLGKSPEEEKGSPIQYCCLGNPMDRAAWWAMVHRVTRGQTQFSD